MKQKIAPNSRLEEYFIAALKELYWSEVNLISVLTTMSEVASNPELQKAFKTHTEQTADQVIRLDSVFEIIGIPAEQVHCVGLQGLFDEGWKVIDETEAGPQRDMALIIAAQKVEHYEIACYGSMCTLAKTMGRENIAKILAQTLQEEKETDQLLTELAEADVNQEASEEPASV